MSCPAGSSKIWGSQEAVDSAELTRVMLGIQHVRGHQANLLFPQLPVQQALSIYPYATIKRVPCMCVRALVCAWAGGEQELQQGQEARRKPCKGMASKRSISPHPYRKESLAHHSSSRTRVCAQGVSLHGGGRGRRGPWPPLHPPLGLTPLRWVRDVAQDSLPPSIVSRWSQHAQSPGSGKRGTAGLITLILRVCLMQQPYGNPRSPSLYLLCSETPGSNSLLKLGPV